MPLDNNHSNEIWQRDGEDDGTVGVYIPIPPGGNTRNEKEHHIKKESGGGLRKTNYLRKGGLVKKVQNFHEISSKFIYYTFHLTINFVHLKAVHWYRVRGCGLSVKRRLTSHLK